MRNKASSTVFAWHRVVKLPERFLTLAVIDRCRCPPALLRLIGLPCRLSSRSRPNPELGWDRKPIISPDWRFPREGVIRKGRIQKAVEMCTLKPSTYYVVYSSVHYTTTNKEMDSATLLENEGPRQDMPLSCSRTLCKRSGPPQPCGCPLSHMSRWARTLALFRNTVPRGALRCYQHLSQDVKWAVPVCVPSQFVVALLCLGKRSIAWDFVTRWFFSAMLKAVFSIGLWCSVIWFDDLRKSRWAMVSDAWAMSIVSIFQVPDAEIFFYSVSQDGILMALKPDDVTMVSLSAGRVCLCVIKIRKCSRCFGTFHLLKKPPWATPTPPGPYHGVFRLGRKKKKKKKR